MAAESGVSTLMQLMTRGVLNFLLVCANQVTLELDELSLDQRYQVLFDVRSVFTFHVEDVLVVILVVEELVQGNGGGERTILCFLFRAFHGESELHVVDTQSLSFSLCDITISVHRGDFGDNKLPQVVFIRGVDDLLTKILLCPRKTVSIDPVPGVSIAFKKNLPTHTSCWGCGPPFLRCSSVDNFSQHMLIATAWGKNILEPAAFLSSREHIEFSKSLAFKWLILAHPAHLTVEFGGENVESV